MLYPGSEWVGGCQVPEGVVGSLVDTVLAATRTSTVLARVQYSPGSTRYIYRVVRYYRRRDRRKILTQPLTLEHCTTLAVGADTEWVEQDWCIAKLTGIAIPQHDSGHATTAALKRELLQYLVLSGEYRYQPGTYLGQVRY